MHPFVELTTAAILLALLPVRHVNPSADMQAGEVYNGVWWQSVSQEERSGFVRGVVNCYVGDYGAPPGIGGDSTFDGARDSTTAYYQANPTHTNEPVLRVLLARRGAPPRANHPARETRHPRKLKYLDGFMWKQMTNNGDHSGQLGFLKGYLSCLRLYVPKKARSLSGTPIEYQVWITQWYRYDEATDTIDTQRQDVPIADALFRVRHGLPARPVNR